MKTIDMESGVPVKVNWWLAIPANMIVIPLFVVFILIPFLIIHLTCWTIDKIADKL